MSKNKRNFRSAGFYITLFVVIVLIVSYLYQGPAVEEKVYSDLISDIQAGNVKELTVKENVASVVRMITPPTVPQFHQNRFCTMTWEHQ